MMRENAGSDFAPGSDPDREYFLAGIKTGNRVTPLIGMSSNAMGLSIDFFRRSLDAKNVKCSD
jgi:hypothetical protein